MKLKVMDGEVSTIVNKNVNNNVNNKEGLIDMAYNIVEYWRGLEENRVSIDMGSSYGPLDPDAFYLGLNMDIEGDGVIPSDLSSMEKRSVMTYDSPRDPGEMKELHIDGYQGFLMEVS